MGQLCFSCGVRLHASIEGDYHPDCGPNQLENRTLEKLKDIIRWADSQSARSQQVNIGPSELGTNCDRYLAYRMVGAPTVNVHMDPWRAIVGTAIHLWLEQAVIDYQKAHPVEWETEAEVPIDPLVDGHSDLFDMLKYIVVDYKTMTATKLKDFRANGASQPHIEQVQMYGKGQVARGRTVKWVCIIAIPRDGWLGDFAIQIVPYDPAVAQKPIDRLYSVAGIAMGLDLEHTPGAFEKIPAAPSRLCGWCPFYRPSSKYPTADLGGCPGDARSADAKAAEGILAISREES